VLAATAVALGLRVFAASPAVETVDAVFFLRGVERYSVLEARPHWPGYPIYIALAKLLAWVVGDAETALRTLSILASAFSTVWIMWLVEAWRGRTSTTPMLAAGLLWAVAPLAVLGGAEIGSDSLGLCLVLAAAGLAVRGRLGMAVVTSGLLLGVRLPYAALLGPIVRACAGTRSTRRIAGLAALTAGVIASWLLVQLAADGASWLAAARDRLAAHYGNWWERAIADGHWFQRPASLLETTLVHGIGGWWPGLPLLRLPVTLGWTVLVVAGLRRVFRSGLFSRRPRASGSLSVIGWMIVPYILLVLAFNDVTLARYALPLVAVLCLLAGLAMPQAPRAFLAVVFVLFLPTVLVVVPLVRAHRDQPALGVQWVRFVTSRFEPDRTVLAVTDEAPLVGLAAETYAPGFAQQAVRRGELGTFARAQAARGRTVYSVVPDAGAPHEWVALACFAREPLLDSRGPFELWLFRHGGPPPVAPVRCGAE
jgi:hypothetical protein